MAGAGDGAGVRMGLGLKLGLGGNWEQGLGAEAWAGTMGCEQGLRLHAAAGSRG